MRLEVREAAIIIIGIIGASAGVLIWSYKLCVVTFFRACSYFSRPYGLEGVLLMIVGGYLIVIGIVFALITPRRRGVSSTQTPSEERKRRYCLNCGTSLPPDIRFCSRCGYDSQRGMPRYYYSRK